LKKMTGAGAEIPNFRTYNEGDPIPPVNPDDLKRRWNIKRPWTLEDLQAAWGHEADSSAVSSRYRMIGALTCYKLLTPWQHGKELDDAVFRIAATFPLRELKHKNYMVPGDEHFGFDPNAFVQRLIEETGIAHVWEPVATKVPEGGRAYSTVSATFKGQIPDLEREAKYQARELVWHIWKRCAPSLDQVLSNTDKEDASEMVARFFADFLMDNIDLVRQLEASFMAGNGGGPLCLWIELERKAQGSA
jgi:hypothetical protein